MPLAGQTVLALDFTPCLNDNESTDETGFTDTTYVGGATPCGGSFTAPTSGTVIVHFRARFEPNTANTVFVSAAVREGAVLGSGTSVSASDDNAAIISQAVAGADTGASSYRTVTGLTPGSTYNAQVEFRIDGGNGDIFQRHIFVMPTPPLG